MAKYRSVTHPLEEAAALVVGALLQELELEVQRPVLVPYMQ